MRVERLSPRVPDGFPDPGLVALFDSGNFSRATTTISYANGTVRTQQGGSTFTTDLTMFVTRDLLASTNATLETVHVGGSASPSVQAWRVDENTLDSFIGGIALPSNTPVNARLVWFERDTLMKIRESTNYTDSSYGEVVSVETLEDTNMPQLKTSLTSQGSYSSQSSSLQSSSATSLAVQSPGYVFDAAALTAVIVTIAVTGITFCKTSQSRLNLSKKSRAPARASRKRGKTKIRG